MMINLPKALLFRLIPPQARRSLRNLRLLSGQDNLPKDLLQLKRDVVLLKVLDYFDHHSDSEYSDEVAYLRAMGTAEVFPYP